MNENQIIVSKFGGTSMGNAECMSRSAHIAIEQRSFIIVVSATSGTTNDLLLIGKNSKDGNWDESELLITKIKNKHNQIANELKLQDHLRNDLNILFTELDSMARGIFLLRDCSSKALDSLLSLGERLSSILFTQSLQNEFASRGLAKKAVLLDVRSFLKTDDQFGKATPIISEIKSHCHKIFTHQKDSSVYITQGFIGQTLGGFTTTLGRGGSDYSAALIAEGINADILEIWTDVPGIATTDPRTCERAKTIKEISFTETSELATFGAKVLHPATLLPAIRKNIPVFVGSSFEPNKSGTWVRQKVKESPLVRAIATRKKQVLLTLTTPEMLQSHGFLFQIFKVFNDHKISIDAITTSEISVSMTLDNGALLNKKIIEDLSPFAEVHVEENLALVALIGNNMNHTPGLASKVFTSISDVNVRMICLGASRHNFCFLVQESEADRCVKLLHSEFIEN